MRAAMVRNHGGLDAISIEDVPEPTPGPGQALIEVRCCALNHMDLWVRKGVPGHRFPLPLIPGCDIAGVVIEADGFSAGDEVVLQPGVSCGRCKACLSGRDHLCPQYGILGETQNGGCAEQVLAPLQNVIPKPANLSFEEAAAYPLAFLTAWHMVVRRARITAGETVLVHAAGSGVSSAAIQICRMLSARVFATAGSERKLARARELGAEVAINYSDTPDWSRRVHQLTGKRGVNAVIDHVGVATFADSIRCLSRGGRYVLCGATTGGQASVDLHRVFFKSLSVLGSTMGSKGELLEVTEHIASGRLKPLVDRVIPLEEIREAHRVLEARQAFGKVVVRCTS